MTRTIDRILATHAGSLPRPDDLRRMVLAKGEAQLYDPAKLSARLREAVAEVVKRQVACGIDSVNDGEFSKVSFSRYVEERISGIEIRKFAAGEGPIPLAINGRDRKLFPEYFAAGGGAAYYKGGRSVSYCVAPLTYIGQDQLREDVANFGAALADVTVESAFLPANSPGTIEHWLHNEHYATQEEFLFAIADVMHEEYKGIVDAGFLLQVDDPDLADAWQMYPEMGVAEYRNYARLRVDALNHALRDLPLDRIRLHACWGSPKGPHEGDLPLEHIVDLVFSVRAGSYSIEASNPRHEHEWRVFEQARIPEGSVLIPGVVGHYTDWIEHPELIADRLIRYTNLVGRENVIASTDCGLGLRVPPEIAWAKLAALGEGARIATRRLWGRAA